MYHNVRIGKKVNYTDYSKTRATLQNELIPSNVCWSRTSRLLTSISSPWCSAKVPVAPDDAIFELLELLVIMFGVWVLALGRAGIVPLLSWMSVRAVITPNVWDAS